MLRHFALVSFLLLAHTACSTSGNSIGGSKDIVSSPDINMDQDTNDIITRIVDEIQSWLSSHAKDRPFVTVTFAQSLDGKIASRESGGTSSNLPLSGVESLYLTHGLRSIHDAILVGGRTLSIDNPRLSNRLWGIRQPRPVVLDSSLRHVLQLGSSLRAQELIVCCSHDAAAKHSNIFNVTLLPCECHEDGRLNLDDVLARLGTVHGIRSIMVEGGASVLSAFVSARLVDCCCITTSPKLIGSDCGLAGVTTIGKLPDNDKFLDLARHGQTSKFVPLGMDCVYLCHCW